jgi:glycosyltransferase involved in cell wall biosynthesis
MSCGSEKSVVLLDISRLIWRARRSAPTGIDRVELAYAYHFVTGRQERPAYAVLHLLGFVVALSPAGGRRFIEALGSRWEGTQNPTTRTARLSQVLKIYLGLFLSVWYVGPWLRRKLGRHPGAPIFLVVSHHHIARGYTIERVRRGLQATTACLIHDLIPLEYPEYLPPGWESRYQCISDNLAHLFDAVIVNSESTAQAVRACMPSSPRKTRRALVRCAPLGARAFPGAKRAGNNAPSRPYFAVLGTIEPRKNHLLLLNLWARLAVETSLPPRLIVVGARGWENEQVVDMLERSRRLRGLVEERNHMSDAEVGMLLANARALLVPSFAEGFGLPLAEALASSVPVLCSDIPVFRELGKDVPEYIDPLDLHAWKDAVHDYSQPSSGRRRAQLARLQRWRPPAWSDHFACVEQLFTDLDKSRSRTAAPIAIGGDSGAVGA